MKLLGLRGRRGGTLAAEGGPWSGGGEEGAGAKPRADGDPADKPRNPWAPPPLGARPPRDGRAPGLEAYFRRRGGGGGGGNPFGRLPGLNGRPWWMLVVVGVLVLWVLLSSVWLIGPQQQGVVTTFGQYTRTLGPGPAFTLPAPFERLVKVDTGAINTMAIGSEADSQENRVLTGDSNIIDMAYEVRWSVNNPVLYSFQLDDPVETVRDVAESAMRATIANYSLNQAIGPARSQIANDVLKRMQAVLDSYRAGILVQGINIRQSDPPNEVLEAYKRVNAAKQQRESYLNQARTYAEQVLQRAQGDTAEFDKVYAQYKAAPEVTRRRLYYDTMESVLSGVDKTVIEAPGVQSYLPLPELRRRPAETPAAPAEAQP